MNSFRHAFKMSHKKCNAKFCYRTQYHLPISKLFASSFSLSTKKHTGHARHCFHHNPRLNQVVFWRSLAFCTSAPRRIWRASQLVAFWTSGRLWSWKVLNDDVSNTGTRSKRWNNEWSEIGKMKYIEIEGFSNLTVWACAALVVGWEKKPNSQKLSKTCLSICPFCHISPSWTCHRSLFIMFILVSWQSSVSRVPYVHLTKICMHWALNLWWCLLPSIKPAIWRGWSKISIVPGLVEHMIQSISITFGCPLWNLSNHTLPTCTEKRTGANIIKQNPGIIWSHQNGVISTSKALAKFSDVGRFGLFGPGQFTWRARKVPVEGYQSFKPSLSIHLEILHSESHNASTWYLYVYIYIFVWRHH